MQLANPTSKEHELQEAQQVRSRKRSKGTDQFSRSAMSACKLFNYCRQVHRYGISFCKAYGAICSYCQQINHVEEACFFKHPHLGKFKNTRSRKISKSKKTASTFSAFTSIDSRSEDEVNEECSSGTDTEAGKFSRNCYGYKQQSEKKNRRKILSRSKRKISERIELKKEIKHSKSVQTKHNQMKKTSNSYTKTWLEHEAECMEMTIYPYEEKKKKTLSNKEKCNIMT